MMWYGDGWSVTHWLLMLAFWAAVIVGLVLLIRTLIDSNRGPGRDRALDITRERYARGEITKAEYEALRHDLER